jgi:hypothetical protein
MAAAPARKRSALADYDRYPVVLPKRLGEAGEPYILCKARR